MKKTVSKLLLAFASLSLTYMHVNSGMQDAYAAGSIYIAQTAQGSQDGSSCANAKAVSFFNTAANWGSAAAQIGPGTTVHVCGTFTGSANSTMLTVRGSGSAGSPITILFEPGAVLQAPYWNSASGAISLAQVSYIILDGGPSGLIKATDCGTARAYQMDDAGVVLGSCNNCEVKNLTISELYVRIPASGESKGGGTNAIWVTGGNNVFIHDNKIDSAKVGIYYTFPGGTSITNSQIYNNNIKWTSTGIVYGSGNTNAVSSNVAIFNNDISDAYPWAGNFSGCTGDCWFHSDGIHIWAAHAGSRLTDLSIYNNYIHGDLGDHVTCWIYPAGNLENVLVYNNLLTASGSSYPTNGFIGVSGAGIKVYNNTMIGGADSSKNYMGIGYGGTGGEITNNIFYGTGRLGIIYADQASATLSSCDYNIYYPNNNFAFLYANKSSTFLSYAQWQALGFDAHSVIVNPNFDSQYHLQVGSSAIGSGVNLTSAGIAALNADKAGIARPATGAWDAGAYQYQVLAAADIIPAERRIDWSQAGARNDWTTRNSVFTTLSPSGGNDTAAIQNAIASCPQGQVVKLNPGTFKISASIVWGNKPHVTLRGSGKGTTVLQGQPGFSGRSFFDFYSGRGASPDWDWTLTQAVSLASGLSKGSARINTSGNHTWAAGDYILIDQLNNGTGNPPEINYACGWCSRENGARLRGQIVKVTNVVDSDTVDISPSLYFDYDPARSPQGKKANTKLEGISIENLTVDNTLSDAPDIFYIYNLFDSSFTDLNLNGIPSGSQSRHFHFYNSLWLTVRHSEIHGAEGDQTNQGYGMFFGYATSGILIEDNAFYSLILATAFEGVSSGNVIAYNFTKDSRWYDTGANRLMIINHGGGSMNLIEGNVIEGRYREDSYFASGHWNTVFRNTIQQMPGKTDQLQTYDLERGHHYNNAVGNVLGTTGWETVYEQAGTNSSSSTKAIFRLGYDSPWGSYVDPQVKATMLRHGNWDAVTGGVVWDPSISVRTIPQSLYLTAKPAWFGSLPWPPIGPDVNPMINKIPAQIRYEGGVVPPAVLYGDVSGNGSVTAFDASMAAQYSVGSITLTADQITAADVSGNGSVTSYDASLIAQYAVGLIVKFPVQG